MSILVFAWIYLKAAAINFQMCLTSAKESNYFGSKYSSREVLGLRLQQRLMEAVVGQS